ncbi:MAG: PilN domain-containing protein [Kiritimatiellia bacterium]
MSLVAGPDGLHGVRMSRSGEGWSAEASGFWPLPPRGDSAESTASPDEPSAEAAGRAPDADAADESNRREDARWAGILRRAAAELGGGTLSLALPTSQLLVKVLELPSEAGGDLEEIVPLQMEAISPFPGDELASSHETLAETETTLRVFAAALPKPTADRWDARLSSAGLKARRIDSALLGWWWTLSSARVLPQGDGRNVVLIGRAGEWDVLLLEGGAPVLCRSLGSERSPQDLALDLTLSLLSAELKGSGKAVEELLLVSDAAPGPQLPDMLSKAAGGAPVRFVDFAELGPAAAGCARRAAQSAPLDLLPASWRERELSAVARKRYFGAMAVAGLAWVLLLAGLLLAPKIHDRIEARMREAVERDKPAYAEVRDVRDRVRLIRSYMDRSRSMLECLRVVVGVLPDEVLFTSLTYRREDGLKIAGEAPEARQVYAFQDAVSNCGLFDNSTLTGPTRNAARRVERFEVDARFDPKPEREGGRR